MVLVNCSRYWLRNKLVPSLSVGNSCAGSKFIPSTLSLERWFSGSNKRISSISSSKKSNLNGVLLPIGNISRIAPRAENSPCSITWSTLRYPLASRFCLSWCKSFLSPFLMIKLFASIYCLGAKR